jgi:hypothetical protein
MINNNKNIFIYTNPINNKLLEKDKAKIMLTINRSIKLPIKDNKIMENKRKQTILTNSIK